LGEIQDIRVLLKSEDNMTSKSQFFTIFIWPFFNSNDENKITEDKRSKTEKKRVSYDRLTDNDDYNNQKGFYQDILDEHHELGRTL
jgi:hypothetical protein